MTEVLEWLPLNLDKDSCFGRLGLGGRVSAAGEGCSETTGFGMLAGGFGGTSGAG